MDLSEESFQHLLERVYDAAEFPDRWRQVYDSIRQALGVASIHVLALDKRHGTLSYSDGSNLPVQGELAYMQHYRFIDPRTPVLLERPLGGWMHCHEVVSEEAAASHPFYQEFLLPYDRRYTSGTKLVDTPEATVVFSALSTAQQGPLSREQLAFLDRLMPHMRRACRIGLQNFIYSSQALVGHTLVNRLRQPVVLMTAGGDVMHVNQAANDLLRRTKVVAIEDGKLRLPQPSLDDLLRRCGLMEQGIKAGQAGGSEPQGGFQSLQVRTAGGGSVYAFFSMLAPQTVLGTFGLRPVVMLIFYDPDSAPAIDPSLLYAVFGLTPAEARIASLLAEGLSLKEIAQQQGTQHETVRKQLRSIYIKTSTNRQPDLVRLLLHLPNAAVQD
jgi:DNA-binding CsgD family transcriptional regulator